MKRVLLSIALVFLAETASAHGTCGRLDEAHGLQVQAAYDDGEPMSYAEVEIRAAEEGSAFQTGRTDRNGMFLFLPDRPGKWRVTVNDGMGHQLVLAKEMAGPESPIPVKKTDLQLSAAPPAKKMTTNHWPGILAGLGIIYGSAGFFYGLSQRRLRLGCCREGIE